MSEDEREKEREQRKEARKGVVADVESWELRCQSVYRLSLPWLTGPWCEAVDDAVE